MKTRFVYMPVQVGDPRWPTNIPCLCCLRPVAVHYRDLHPAVVIDGELLGIVCAGCLTAKGREHLAALRSEKAVPR